ncbi:hypothetical protein [Shewanella woodyi]|uniref:Uncharacterized protein n=1 Tax=Shewanella woodyi (strain ATCC 51908 / MS32) TaxID=392500 RepID=B1KE17_SHEWM|nr:hypothetical protein [Shewanella woodyi]ACA85003.1 hypothetical protein Swoo_0708 [Shewanella woodyi ATCC 51908]
MTRPSYKVVLSDKLFSIYKKASLPCLLRAKERKAYDLLMGNIELDILTNAAQVQRCKDDHNLPEEVYNDLYPILLNLDDQKDLSLEQLSKETLFKLIVTIADGENSPPFFNLKKQHIKRNYTLSCLHDEEREPLKDYLVCLLQGANKVLIHDKYFSSEDDNKQIFTFLPDKDIIIQYVENGERSNGRFVRDICGANAKWKVEQCDTTQAEFNRFARSHDRYLIINEEIELTLTSGFSYIWNKEKEITCVVRELLG